MTVGDVPGDFIGTGIQLDAVGRQDQQPVGRHPHMLVPDQMVADFDKGLFHPPLGNAHQLPQEQGQWIQKIDDVPGPEIKDPDGGKPQDGQNDAHHPGKQGQDQQQHCPSHHLGQPGMDLGKPRYQKLPQAVGRCPGQKDSQGRQRHKKPFFRPNSHIHDLIPVCPPVLHGRR